MSTSNSPEAGNSPAVEKSPPAKRRSPIERAVVWGGILILLAILAVEYVGVRAQKSALATLTERMETGDSSGNPLRAAEVRTIVGKEPIRDEDIADQNLAINAKRMEVYRWFSLSPLEKRELYVYYGTGGIGGEAEQDVINVTTTEDTEVYQHGKAHQAPITTPPAGEETGTE